MFTIDELDAISRAIIVQIKSVERLGNKEGQPESVAAEYRKVHKSLLDLSVKVIRTRDDLKAKEGKK